MRTAPLLLAALLPMLASCSSAGSGFEPGAWRVGLGMDFWDDSSLSDADVDQDVITADVGKLLGANSEFGLRVTSGDLPDQDVETASIGPYYRWYFNPVLSARPWIDAGVSFAGLDNGAGEESGWEWSAAAGAAWYFLANLGLEAYVRVTNGNFDTEDLFTTQAGVGLSYLW